MKQEVCRQCGNPLVHIEGRRAKEFCKDSCRVKFHYANKPKIIVQDLTKPKTTELKPPKTTNVVINTKPSFKNDVEEMFWEEEQLRLKTKTNKNGKEN